MNHTQVLFDFGSLATAKSLDYSAFKARQPFKIRGPSRQYRQFKMREEALARSARQRRSRDQVAPTKLLDLHPQERTTYDFDQYGERTELFGTKVPTQADYTDGCQRVFDLMNAPKNVIFK